jgi:hypothetical protein
MTWPPWSVTSPRETSLWSRTMLRSPGPAMKSTRPGIPNSLLSSSINRISLATSACVAGLPVRLREPSDRAVLCALGISADCARTRSLNCSECVATACQAPTEVGILAPWPPPTTSVAAVANAAVTSSDVRSGRECKAALGWLVLVASIGHLVVPAASPIGTSWTVH